MSNHEILVLPGDGIGPEVVEATTRVLSAAAERHGVILGFRELPVGLSAYETHGTTLPASTLEALPTREAWLLGPVTHHVYDVDSGKMPNPSGYLRKTYRLHANVRPARSYPGVNCLFDNVDLVIVRENTEGFYADRNVLNGSSEMVVTADVTVSLRVVTREASLRVAENAFALARRRGRDRARPPSVTALHKANVLRRGDGLFLDACRQVATRYPEVEFNDLHADAFALHVLRDPGRFDVLVTTNLFGDVLSDLTAGIVGGLGLAPGLNVGADHAMAQATHGSAPDIAGRGIANPVAEILSGGMLLDWLGDRYGDERLVACSAAVQRAVGTALRNAAVITPDLGGNGTSESFTDAVIASLDGASHEWQA
jgi:3-isopropylmalate dehydrogenase